jgi:hypothetical protein
VVEVVLVGFSHLLELSPAEQVWLGSESRFINVGGSGTTNGSRWRGTMSGRRGADRVTK